jgi:serine-type D-Ala-D-Ala carboxypeptidase (penicillin-binding protein 5/6)
MQNSTRKNCLVVVAALIASATLGTAMAATGSATAQATAKATAAQSRSANREAASTVLHRPPVPGDEVGGPLLARHGIVVQYPGPGAPHLPDVPASAYVIADAGTGAVLAAKDPHGLFQPASTLKVLTAITMLPRLRPDATVIATKRAASVEPNIIGLIAGHPYKIADLFRALLMISANDAAVALVEASGSFSKGMSLLNAEAHHLQAYDVVAKHPNGLPAPGQDVSAYDLALIARQALSMPAFMRYDSTRTAWFPLKRHERVLMVNQNYLLTQYRGGLGGKIGWTTTAGATYIGLARRHGVTLIVTILHATPQTEVTSAEQLLDWGFAMSSAVRPVGVLVPPLPVVRAVTAGKQRARAAVGNSLPGATATKSGRSAVIGVGVAAGLCACVIGGLAWLRRRALRRARPGNPSG